MEVSEGPEAEVTVQPDHPDLMLNVHVKEPANQTHILDAFRRATPTFDPKGDVNQCPCVFPNSVNVRAKASLNASPHVSQKSAGFYRQAKKIQKSSAESTNPMTRPNNLVQRHRFNSSQRTILKNETKDLRQRT